MEDLKCSRSADKAALGALLTRSNAVHHTHNTEHRHNHDFDLGKPLGERGTRRVVFLTATMMVIEIVAGWLTNSMTLLADGL